MDEKKIKGKGNMLTLICWGRVVRFIEEHRDFLHMILSVKGLHNFVANQMPLCCENVVFVFKECPSGIRSYVHTVCVKGEKEFSRFQNEMNAFFQLLPNLKNLDVRVANSSGKSDKMMIQDVGTIEKLCYVHILGSDAGGSSSKGTLICSCANLKEIEVTTNHFFFFNKLPKLESLILKRTIFSKEDFYECLPKLQKLHLYLTKKNKFEEFPSQIVLSGVLKDIRIEDHLGILNDWKERRQQKEGKEEGEVKGELLIECPQLECLRVVCWYPNIHFNVNLLLSSSCFHSFELEGTLFNLEEVQTNLKKLRSLRHLSLSGRMISMKNHQETFTGLEHLKTLSLKNLNYPSSFILTNFSKLESLKMDFLPSSPTSKELELKELSSMKELTILNVEHFFSSFFHSYSQQLHSLTISLHENFRTYHPQQQQESNKRQRQRRRRRRKGGKKERMICLDQKDFEVLKELRIENPEEENGLSVCVQLNGLSSLKKFSSNCCDQVFLNGCVELEKLDLIVQNPPPLEEFDLLGLEMNPQQEDEDDEDDDNDEEIMNDRLMIYLMDGRIPPLQQLKLSFEGERGTCYFISHHLEEQHQRIGLNGELLEENIEEKEEREEEEDIKRNKIFPNLSVLKELELKNLRIPQLYRRISHWNHLNQIHIIGKVDLEELNNLPALEKIVIDADENDFSTDIKYLNEVHFLKLLRIRKTNFYVNDSKDGFVRKQ